ncbi:hypothetical protein L1987_00152 [Smallanthus sonchifolius]|uniref:Uncharacterized protein n=1 Tax=Smallanthus sonchifolius TaxID=185202 RepID=A0ACB9K1F5_9ASTR|nr:hypothetical protein L1987_00152 [Smallanthus sonchifolius]
MAGLPLAAGGWSNNIIVYLINEFNIKSIDAAQIANVVNGCMALFPILGAILADSYLGSFIVISVSSLISMVGILVLTLTSTLDTLKPTPCENGPSTCAGPSKAQIGILYTSLALSTVGMAGTRFMLAVMGADQFHNPKHDGVFFNWYFFTMYAAMLVSMVGIVYIQDNVSWGLGYGLSGAANLIGLAAFVLGRRHYQLLKPQGSPFTGLTCVLVAAFRKRKALLSLKIEDYCQEPQPGGTKLVSATPTSSFKFLNHAALVTPGDLNSDGSINKPWNLCTLQQVEDLKTLIRISPIWSTGILVHTPIATQMSLVVLQALAMDHHLGQRTAAAMVAVLIGIAFYLGTAVVDFIMKTTGWLWLPDGINDGRMDNVYWVLTIAGLVNFGYYLVRSWMYKYQNVENKEVISSNPC